MHTLTSLLTRYTAGFTLKILSRIVLLTDTNCSRMYNESSNFWKAWTGCTTLRIQTVALSTSLLCYHVVLKKLPFLIIAVT